jgi:hypothetical protein
VTEVQVVVLVAEQRERVVDRDRAQVGVDLVALDLRVVEVVEALAALVRLLDVALVELVVVLHRLARDPVQVAVERRELTRLDLIPRHGFSLRSLAPPTTDRPRCAKRRIAACQAPTGWEILTT